MKNIFVLISLLILTFFYSNANLDYESRNEVYRSIDFKENPISQDVFSLALKGYETLNAIGRIKKQNILSVIDYSLHSSKKRLWVLDLTSREVLFNEWVAHGKYTGDSYATRFSNQISSKQSSLGFFVTGQTYDGKHAYSLKLHGQERNFNSNAFQRGIVIHGADYVSKDFISKYNRIGRSYGCPAIRQVVKYDLIKTIKDGSCLFAYYPSQQYLSNSSLIN